MAAEGKTKVRLAETRIGRLFVTAAGIQCKSCKRGYVADPVTGSLELHSNCGIKAGDLRPCSECGKPIKVPAILGITTH